MQTTHAADVEWGEVSGHRSGEIEFKRLLQGTPGSPDNFELSIVRTAGDYFTPRHRHNFDQVRLCLEGAMNFAPGKDQRLQIGEAFFRRLIQEDEPILRTIHFHDGLLIDADRALARFLQYVRRFPTARPAAD